MGESHISVTHYNKENPHPSGFIGYRVAVMVNKKHNQSYFNTKHDDDESHQYRLAHKQNSSWLREKEIVQSQRNNQAMPTSRAKNSTGVRGIQKYYVLSPNRQGEYVYRHLKYVVNGSQHGTPFFKTFPTTEKGWHEAVGFLAKSKGLTRWRHLLERQIFD